jgi:hypothetical protein
MRTGGLRTVELRHWRIPLQTRIVALKLGVRKGRSSTSPTRYYQRRGRFKPAILDSSANRREIADLGHPVRILRVPRAPPGATSPPRPTHLGFDNKAADLPPQLVQKVFEATDIGAANRVKEACQPFVEALDHRPVSPCARARVYICARPRSAARRRAFAGPRERPSALHVPTVKAPRGFIRRRLTCSAS